VAFVNEAAGVAAGEAEIPEKGRDVVKELDQFKDAARKVAREEGEPGARAGGGLGKWRGAGALAGIDAGGTRENDPEAQFLERPDDPGNVNGFRPGAPGAEVVED
jgi:hypothetical protein